MALIDPNSGLWQSLEEEARGSLRPAPAMPAERRMGAMPGVPEEVDLAQYGLDPEDWGVDYEPERAQIRSMDEAYAPGWKGTAQRYLPVLTEAFAATDWQSPMARMAARLAGSVGGYLDHETKLRQAQIAADNVRENQLVGERNQYRRSQALQNRASWLTAAKERIPLPREVLQRKLDEKKALNAAGAAGTVEGRTGAQLEAGLTPTGTPKPPKTKKYNPTSFKLLADPDKIAIDAIEQEEKQYRDELKDMKSNTFMAVVFQPVRIGRNGKPVPEGPDIVAGRVRRAELEDALDKAKKKKNGAYKMALLAHLQNIPDDENEALGVLAQLDRSAKALGLDADPEVKEALDDAHETFGKGE